MAPAANPATAPALVILAAGLGRRFGGPKQLVPVGPGGESILDYNRADGAAAGFDPIVVVTRPELADRIHAEHLALQYVPRGRTKPLGTTEAVVAAGAHLAGAFAVANADDLYGPRSFSLLAQHMERLDADDAVVVGYPLKSTVPLHGAVSRAVLAFDDPTAPASVTAIVEVHGIERDGVGFSFDPASELGGPSAGSLNGEELVSVNLWGFGSGVLARLRARVDAFAPADDEELFLPEVVGDLLTEGTIRVTALRTPEPFVGMTNPDDLERVRNHARTRVLE